MPRQRWNTKYFPRRVIATILKPRICRANSRAPGVAIVRRQCTVAPVIVETCFFLSSTEKAELLDWTRRGGIAVLETPVESYAEIAAIIARYAERDIDLADAALIWLANASGQHRILTVDEHDFSAYRLKQGKRFDLVKWT